MTSRCQPCDIPLIPNEGMSGAPGPRGTCFRALRLTAPRKPSADWKWTRNEDWRWASPANESKRKSPPRQKKAGWAAPAGLPNLLP